MSRMRSHFDASVATSTPPATMPRLNAISKSARFTTLPCSPEGNDRTSSSGMRFPGATVSTKMIPNRRSSHRTTSWSAT